MSELKLLLDQSYPLLREFRDLCPGTFKHSIEVSLLVESVSSVLKLDIDFMKVCAVYHDIGKMTNPKFFSENQKDEDLYNDLDPWISYNIITRHVSDSVNILINDKHFPREIIETISQHHGTSLVKYFFNKAKNGNIDLNEHEFRYKCYKPKTIESGLLMICDQIEVASSVKENYNTEVLVEDIIGYLLNDGQLDDVVMRLGDLKLIKQTLIEELESRKNRRVDHDKE